MDVKFSNVRDIYVAPNEKYKHWDGTTRDQVKIFFKSSNGEVTWVIFESDDEINLDIKQCVEVSST